MIAAWVVGLLMALRLAWALALSAMNRLEVRRSAASPPDCVPAVMDGETFSRAIAYTLARSRLGDVEDVAEAVILAFFVFSGVLPALYRSVDRLGEPGAPWSGALFMLAAGALMVIASLPFDWWGHFRLESKFGFNRSSTGLWLGDQVKQAAVAGILGFPLLTAVLALARRGGPAWWLWGFGVVFGFQMAVALLYPRLILPLFNRLEPLPEGELRSRLLALGERTGFRSNTIEVIDGSRRSAHSNAFFTGFGRFRRIVLFDTLMSQCEPHELEAVLAHEIGHYRLGHIPRGLALSGAAMLAGFGAIAWLARARWFNSAFGFRPGELAPSFLLFGLLCGLVTFWVGPLFNLLSRRREYQADAFASRAMGGADSLVSALRKLAVKNLSNLTPHPWYAAFHYSHPTLAEREKRLNPTPPLPTTFG